MQSHNIFFGVFLFSKKLIKQSSHKNQDNIDILLLLISKHTVDKVIKMSQIVKLKSHKI